MECNNNKSMVDVAYDVLVEEKRVLKFDELYKLVSKKIGLSEEEAQNKISKFYTNLSLDGRFVTLQNNERDLRSNQTFEKVHIDMNAVYNEIEDEIKSNIDPDELTDSEKEEEGIIDTDEDESDDYDSYKKDE